MDPLLSGRRRRLIPLLVVLGLVAVLLPLAQPAAVAAPARGIDRVCPPPADAIVADPALPDRGATHGEAIGCAAAYGVVGGFGDGTYRPGLPVTRGQTASGVAAWVEVATGFALDQPDEPVFADQGTTHGAAIAKLATAGIVTGRDDDTFGPDEPLTRGQFARIMVRAISYADLFRVDGPLPPVPAPDEVAFTDIDGSVFADDIRALAGTGITTGVEPDRFAPGDQVTRGQLASFVMRSADYLDRHQRWKPTAVVVTFLTTLEVVVDPSSEPSSDTTIAPDDARLAGLSAILVVNAFNGTVGYLVDLSELNRPVPVDSRLTLRLGSLEQPGPVVLTLADGEQLEAARRDVGIITGTALEADSVVRLADLLLPDTGVVLELQGAASGTLRGLLRRID